MSIIDRQQFRLNERDKMLIGLGRLSAKDDAYSDGPKVQSYILALEHLLDLADEKDTFGPNGWREEFR